MTEHPRWMLRLQREPFEFLEAQIAQLDTQILEHRSDYQPAVDLGRSSSPDRMQIPLLIMNCADLVIFV